MKTVAFTVMSVSELEEMIASTLGVAAHTIEMVANEEWSNDMDRAYYKCDGQLDEWEALSIKESLSDKQYKPYSALTWLNHLVSKGVLQPGNYLISISW